MESLADQLRAYIIRPVLLEMGMHSQGAENLLIGTAAHESAGFKAIHQYGRGPALSFFQIEPATHDDLWRNSIPGIARSKPGAVEFLRGQVAAQYGTPPPAEFLLHSLTYAAAIARLLYWRAPDPMPDGDDLVGLAQFWKRRYNTVHGAGTVDQWLEAYRGWCL